MKMIYKNIKFSKFFLVLVYFSISFSAIAKDGISKKVLGMAPTDATIELMVNGFSEVVTKVVPVCVRREGMGKVTDVQLSKEAPADEITIVIEVEGALVPNIKGLEVLLLVIGAAVGAFAISENLASESGLVAMVVMSLVVGNAAIPHREAFNEGQESISAWLVAIVYVLLAASIDIDSIAGLWPKGFIVVAIVVCSCFF